MSTTPSTASSGSTLTQANFLQLLVTQMTQQDPLNPQSDTAFAAQLAQFSALQQSQNMSNNMSNLQANSLIGMTVGVASSTNSSQTTNGVVTQVDISSGTPEIMVNGKLYDLSQITSVSPTVSTAAGAGAGSTTPTTN